MPTGYTNLIDSMSLEKGEEPTFQAFLFRCARAFGALVTLRDEPLSAPLPQAIEADTTYYDAQIAECESKIVELESMSPEQASALCGAERAEVLARNAKWRADNAKLTDAYEHMRGQVAMWTPPTSEHVELKRFMLEQLDTGSPGDWVPQDPEPMSAPEWLGAQLLEVRRTLASSRERREAEIARTAERNAWLQALVASVKP